MNGTAQPHATLRASVVVATYDRLSETRRLLEQLDRQTLALGSYEVIVVDDGSAVDVRAHLFPSDFRFALRVERQANTGSAAARQLGADQATGDVLVFVDDDMQVPPRFLEAHLAYHGSDDRLVVLGRLRPDERLGRLPLVERYRAGIGDRLSEKVRTGRLQITGEYLYTGNVSIARSLFVEVGGFDRELRLLEDAELGIRLEKAGARFVLSDDACNLHGRDLMTTRGWFERSRRDGVYWSKVARKHPDVRGANPWHFLDLVNPVSRPLLALSALAPAPAALLARSAFTAATAADAIGFERIAIAGATFVYGVQMFRGVGQEAGGARGALREFGEFRRGLRRLGRGEAGSASPFRGLVGAIAEDYRSLVESSDKYDARRPDLRSPGVAFVRNIGFQLVVAYRVMRYMRALELPLATRLVARTIRHVYGSDVHWDAELAPGLVVVHGFGLAISYAARTAPGCILSQNVTLGVGRDATTGVAGGPDLRENVVVGPGAAIIGPIVIGAGSKIMAGCTVVDSVPPRTIVEAPVPSMRPRPPDAVPNRSIPE